MNTILSGTILTAIDIGSSKVAVLITRITDSGELELLGFGVSASNGVQFGCVSNIAQAVQSVLFALESAEKMADIDVKEATINLAGFHILGYNSSGVVAITNKQKSISLQDIRKAVDTASSVRIPPDQEVLHVLARDFKVDNHAGIKDPTGMVGFRLEADVHVISASSTYVRNTEKSIEEAGIHIRDKVVGSLASSYGLLKKSEKELGVAIIDIGFGVIDVIVHAQNGITYTSSLSLGGQHITQDISYGLKTSLDSAEHLKKIHGCAQMSAVDPMEILEVSTIGDRGISSVTRQDLAMIIEARVREMLEIIDIEILKSGKKTELAGGIILSGGTAMLDGIRELAEDVFQMPVSIGLPQGISGLTENLLSPIFVGVVGLLVYSTEYIKKEDLMYEKPKNIFVRLKEWIKENL